MLVGQSAGIDSQICWSVIQLGWIVRYVGRSVNPDRQAGMLFGKSSQIYWLVCQPGQIGWYVG